MAENRSMPADLAGTLALAILGAGPSQVPLIQRARAMGYRAVAIDRDPLAPGFEYADTAIRISTHDLPGILAALRETGYAWAGVLARTTAAEALSSAASIADAFRLPGLTSGLVAIATEKSSLRAFAQAHDLPVPTGIQAAGKDVRVPDEDYPVIVRPDSTIVGKGHIRYCADRGSLGVAVARAGQASANRAADIGRFIEGIDTTCLCRVRKGQAQCLAWWDELVGVTLNGEIAGLGLSTPSVIEGTPAQAWTQDVCHRLARCFPAVEALLLLSFRITDQGKPFLIEVHADLGGDLIAETFLPAAVQAFDFFDLAIAIATDNRTETAPLTCRPTALYYCSADEAPPVANITRTPGAVIIQKERIEANLALLEDIIARRNLNLRKQPRHAEWLGRDPHV